ncbi:MAG: OmpA family protein [Myxococcota bacterium]|jgi:outer membrane protein OmpA-like peptidoglycan-associated protein|nr:OmpA family protein [Myxococcota bacterium]
MRRLPYFMLTLITLLAPLSAWANDADYDGIEDGVDRCPYDPEDLDAFQDEDGCPDSDNDGDGLLDWADQCPMQPENFDGVQDEDGCPEEGQEGTLLAPQPTPLPQAKAVVQPAVVYFASAASSIDEAARAELARLFEAMLANEDVTVRLLAHTDELEARKDALCQARADAVLELARLAGLPASRFETQLVGDKAPMDSNGHATGRAYNRRVELFPR